MSSLWEMEGCIALWYTVYYSVQHAMSSGYLDTVQSILQNNNTYSIVIGLNGPQKHNSHERCSKHT